MSHYSSPWLRKPLSNGGEKIPEDRGERTVIGFVFPQQPKPTWVDVFPQQPKPHHSKRFPLCPAKRNLLDVTALISGTLVFFHAEKASHLFAVQEKINGFAVCDRDSAILDIGESID